MRLAGGSLVIVRAGVVADAAFLLAASAGLVASAVLAGRFTAMLLGPGADLAARTEGMRMLLAIGIAMAAAILVLLRELGAMLMSVRAGDPFVPANAQRLRRIGWSLLALQLLDLPCALVARFYPGLGDAAPRGGISAGGWAAVLIAFVLAGVFATGTSLRADLDGTI